MAFEVGRIILEKFRVERTIAEGGMGLVVAATHLQLEQTVALKVFRGDLGGQSEPLMRFMREAKAAAQLRSEHVGRVLDVGVTEDGTPFMVLEYLEGQSLDNVLAARGPLSISTAAEYAMQACEGLAEAHARGIVHRDIKPSNLFLVERSPRWGTIKILDFGISKVSLALASNITTTLNMGTPCYMSPEQLRSAANVDHRTDIWSLGSTLYELLAGKTPFDPSLPLLSLALEIVTKEPPTLRALRPEIPEALSAIVARCMAKEREERFDSAAALAMALIPFAEQRARVFAERALSITPAGGLRPVGGPEVGDPGDLEVADPEDEDLRTPPAVKIPTTELWKIKGNGISGGVASAVVEDTVRTVIEDDAHGSAKNTAKNLVKDAATDRAQPAPPAMSHEPVPAPPAEQGNPWSLRRKWSRGQLVAVAAGFVFVNGFLALVRLRGERQPPVRAAIVSAPSRPTRPTPPRPSEPPPFNELVVRVSPASARVAIDGLAVRGNPFRGRYRRGEIHEVRASAVGYKPKAREVALANDVVVTLGLDRNEDTPPLRQAPPVTMTRTIVTKRAPALAMKPVARPSPEVPAVRGAAPSMVQDTVDPAGGRAPMRPIQTRSPYEAP